MSIRGQTTKNHLQFAFYNKQSQKRFKTRKKVGKNDRFKRALALCASDSSFHVSVLLLTMAESQSDCEISLCYCKNMTIDDDDHNDNYMVVMIMAGSDDMMVRKLMKMPSDNSVDSPFLPPLQAMVKHKRLNCLQHPTSIALINVKWYVQLFFYKSALLSARKRRRRSARAPL